MADFLSYSYQRSKQNNNVFFELGLFNSISDNEEVQEKIVTDALSKKNMEGFVVKEWLSDFYIVKVE